MTSRATKAFKLMVQTGEFVGEQRKSRPNLPGSGEDTMIESVLRPEGFSKEVVSLIREMNK